MYFIKPGSVWPIASLHGYKAFAVLNRAEGRQIVCGRLGVLGRLSNAHRPPQERARRSTIRTGLKPESEGGGPFSMAIAPQGDVDVEGDLGKLDGPRADALRV
ncbi:hypothetical protein [Ralstonia solanacearum]|uniref:hypothetical protein n=1 Tax=Ralstonia solanacearum TaxID=305 RepID=UPI0006DD10C5|nr:hypothetical protein [Ralstonia solanacearum]